MITSTLRRAVGFAGATGLVLAAGLPALPSSGAPRDFAIHYLDMRGAHGQGPAGTNNLIDHGGPVLSSSTTYTIWWGSSSAWASDVQSGISSFFAGVGGTNFLNTATQYTRGATSTASSPGSPNTWVDPSNPPNSNRVSPSSLGAEVAKALKANAFGGSVNPNGIYFVFTSNFPKGGNYCAWHSDASVNGSVVSVAYMPNTSGVAGCNPGAPSSLSQSEGLSSLANVTSHEFMESVTDPQLNAWYDSSGSEIGDKCAWQFSGTTTFKNHSTWYLQGEWSNAISGCAFASN